MLLKNKSILCLFFALTLFFLVPLEAKRNQISEKTWDLVTPYLLPEDHPIKPTLDKIFSESRANVNLKSLRKAGFLNPKIRKFSHLVVTAHPDLPGYIFKIYLDGQRYFKDRKEYDHWINRIKGAKAIQTLLDLHQWNGLCKVPKKWMYALPEEPAPPRDLKAKNFILVEEDMGIYSAEENATAWKSDLVTKEKLDALYGILEGVGLHDCSKIHNIPFSTDGRIAFIDTESTNQWPVRYSMLNNYLSEEMLLYWKSLTQK